MWKTLGGFTAQISRFQHILPLSTAQINCSGSDLPFFRKPEVGDPRAPDTALMQWAMANSYAVFTHDLDFGTMLALSGADEPSVLQVRCLNVMPEAIGPLVLSVIRSYEAEIEQGALVVADERRQRVRILPLNRQTGLWQPE
jgi:predicted nuclease of predicted toxin-antitoxin system